MYIIGTPQIALKVVMLQGIVKTKFEVVFLSIFNNIKFTYFEYTIISITMTSLCPIIACSNQNETPS